MALRGLIGEVDLKEDSPLQSYYENHNSDSKDEEKTMNSRDT